MADEAIKIITKYSSVDPKRPVSQMVEETASDNLTNSTPVEFQELTCPDSSVKISSIYNYNEVRVMELRGSVMSTKPHRHDYFELILPQTDNFEMQIESMLIQLGKWDVCVLNRTIKHTEHFKKGEEIYYLHLSADYMNNEPNIEKVSLRSFGQISDFFYKDLGAQQRHTKDFIHFKYVGGGSVSPLHKVLMQLRSELERKEAGFQLFGYSLVFRLFCLLTDERYYHAEFINLGSDDGASLALSAKQILDRTNRKITQNDIAEQLNYDAAYINRIFLRHYGYSVSEYNRRRCMQLAADMLLTTNLPINEICRRVGYTNRTHFYNIFINQYGCTPNDYRAQLQNNKKNKSKAAD